MRQLLISGGAMLLLAVPKAQAEVPVFKGEYYLNLIDSDLFGFCTVWPPHDDTCREFMPLPTRPAACKTVRIKASTYQALRTYLARKPEGTPLQLTFTPCSSKVDDVMRITYGNVCVQLKGKTPVCTILVHYNEE